MMYIFSTCKDFIGTMPSLVYDEHDVEDVDTGGEDHIYDEIRYFSPAEPDTSTTERELSKVQPYNPLATEEPRDMYRFMGL